MPEPHILELSTETSGAVLQVLVGESLRETYTGNVIGTGVVTISMPVVNAYAGQALFGVIADQYGRVIGGTSSNAVILNQTSTNQDASFNIAGFGTFGLAVGLLDLTGPLVDTTNKLYSIAGELYWNGATVNQSPFSGLLTNGVIIATSSTTVSNSDALMFESGTLTMKNGIIITAFGSDILRIGWNAGLTSSNNNQCDMVGTSAGYQTSNNNNCGFFGYAAGNNATNTSNALFVGSSAGSGANGANYTVFLGTSVGANSSATFSFFVGYSSGNNSSGNDIYAIGQQAARNMTSAINVIALGVSAGSQASGPQNSTLIGTNAGAGTNAIQYVQFIGYSAGQNSSSLQNSEGYGEYALSGSTGMVSSSAYGANCGSGASSWAYTSALGYHAGYLTSNASDSLFLGRYAGSHTTVFYGSVSIGKQASQYAQKQTDCIHIGSYAGMYSSYGESTPSSSDNIYIGTDAGGSTEGAPCGGNRNIFLGKRSGSYLGIGDARLVIDPLDRGATEDVASLIYGQAFTNMSENVLNLNAVVTARHGVVLPQYSEANTASIVNTLCNIDVSGSSVLHWNGLPVADIITLNQALENRDRGYKWAARHSPPATYGWATLVHDRVHGTTVACTQYGDVRYSTDGFDTYSTTNVGNTSSRAYGIYDHQRGRIFIPTTAGAYDVWSDDGGATWITGTTAIGGRSLSLSGNIYVPSTYTYLMSDNTNGCVWYSADGGETWSQSLSGLTFNYAAIVAHPTDGRVCLFTFVVGSATLTQYISDDGGETWSAGVTIGTNAALQPMSAIWSTKSSKYVVSCKGIVLTSSDGNAWDQYVAFSNDWLLIVEDPNTLCLWRYAQQGPTAVRSSMSSDGGMTWRHWYDYMAGVDNSSTTPQLRLITYDYVTRRFIRFCDNTASSITEISPPI